MLINELPDDCLLIIFSLINDLDDLLNCYKVCSKWSYLIAERTRKAKYLLYTCSSKFLNHIDYVYYGTNEPIDGTLFGTLFPNLIIADFSCAFLRKVKHEDIVAFVKRNRSLKGLIRKYPDDIIFQCCDELEMVSCEYIEPFMIKNGDNIKQLKLCSHTLDEFTEDAHNFPNLERLKIFPFDTDHYYTGPILRRLKILEIDSVSGFKPGIYYGFQLMDSCSNLQSAFIKLDANGIFVDESLIHESLQDLVLEFWADVNWNELKRLLIKYPNLKHLALRDINDLENGHVERLVRMLPKLVLFDVRGCPRVTQTATNYVQDYCKLYGRSLKFYFNENEHEIQSDWPHLSTKSEDICHGFDFMRHCFFKDFTDLPDFLIPIDD